MWAIGVAFLIFALLYVALRSQGGHGATISFAVPPAGTAEGKRIRTMLTLVIVAACAGAGLIVFGSGLTRQQMITYSIIFLAIALSGTIMSIAHRIRKN